MARPVVDIRDQDEPTAVTLFSESEDETEAIGRQLAGVLRGGERIGLAGELGAGKTCLVRGLATGLGISAGKVRSPSFTMIIPYEGGRLPLFHIDLYRLAPGEVDLEALRECIWGSGVCAIEWYDRLGEDMQDWLEISLSFAGENRRRLVARAHGVGHTLLLEHLRELSLKHGNRT